MKCSGFSDPVQTLGPRLAEQGGSPFAVSPSGAVSPIRIVSLAWPVVVSAA